MKISKSLAIAKKFLGKNIKITIDRPLGSKHPRHGFVYEVNYGFIAVVKAPDGENLDAYFLGASVPLSKASGKVVAIIHRLDDDDDKLVVAGEGFDPNNNEIRAAVDFQEKWFDYEILRG